jgi:hypothetical protein
MKRWCTGILCLIGVAFLCVLALPDDEARTGGLPPQLFIELMQSTSGVPGKPGLPGFNVGGIPPDCSSWHELHPTFCTTYHQDEYRDNGDGVVGVCDIIVLNTIPYHVISAGPTYWTTCTAPSGPPTGPIIFEPTQPPTGGNPICETWHEVYPNFCQQIHIDSWQDANQNGVLDVCDEVDVQTPSGPVVYHIDRIECDVTVEPVPVTPNQESTWGKIKSLLFKS